jgi:zinc and cadmium transporter
MPVMVAIAAGGFIYIGASDLIPELHHETDFKKSIICLFAFIFGLALMWLLTLIG